MHGEGLSAREIAVSAIRAQRTNMNVIANNIANAYTTRTPEGGAFRRQLAIFRGEQIGKGVDPSKFGVRVKKLAPDMSPLETVFDPGHPDADKNGYVSYPNVNLSVEMVNLVAAQRAYESNVAVIVSGKRMAQTALQIIQA